MSLINWNSSLLIRFINSIYKGTNNFKKYLKFYLTISFNKKIASNYEAINKVRRILEQEDFTEEGFLLMLQDEIQYYRDEIAECFQESETGEKRYRHYAKDRMKECLTVKMILENILGKVIAE